MIVVVGGTGILPSPMHWVWRWPRAATVASSAGHLERCSRLIPARQAPVVGDCLPQRIAFAVHLAMPFSEPKPSRWSQAHIAEHNVTMSEVAEVLAAEHVEHRGRNDTVLIAGTTDAGRHLIVVAADDDGLAFVVTARDMTASEKRAYRRTMQ